MNNEPKKPDQPIEPKRRADDATGQPEPSATPERPLQHQPGYEAKQKAEEAKKQPKADDDLSSHGNKPRSHAAAKKQHVRHLTPKKTTRRHK